MQLADGVRAGAPLAEGMRRYKTLFNPVMPAMVAAAEQTGNLDQCFALLAEYFEQEMTLIREIRSATVYPTIVIVVAILAVAVLAWVNFMPGDVGGAPAVAAGRGRRRVARDALSHCAGGRAASRDALAVLRRHHASAGRGPVLPDIRHTGARRRAVSGRARSHAAGDPAPIVGRAVQGVYFGVRNGNAVEQSIRSQPAFPAIVRNLVGAGETAGNVDTALLKAGQYLRNDAEYKIRNSSKLAGPVLTIITGIIVLLIAIAFWGSYLEKIWSVFED